MKLPVTTRLLGAFFSAAVVMSSLVLPSQSFAEDLMPVMPEAPEISADFPFNSHYIDILGSKIHYIDKGEGDPILFIHGNPTSSYLWRNVIPHLETQGRVIALDLIGMGKSGKPDIDYTFADHIQYVEGFIDTLKLKNITLVLHDWGSALGLDYASRHENNVKGIAFMEAIVPPGMPVASYEVMGPPGESFRTMRDPIKGPELIIKQNMFIEQLLPSSVIRKLTESEMDAYRAPFLDLQSRKPILVWPNEIPIAGVPENTTRVISTYGKWMVNTDLPMLHLHASPGALNPPQVAEWLVQNVNNIESSYIGPGIHFVQEDHPHVIGHAIADWRRRLMK